MSVVLVVACVPVVSKYAESILIEEGLTEMEVVVLGITNNEKKTDSVDDS